MIDLRTVWSDQITPQIQRIRRDLQQYPDQALREYRNLTPRDRGTARRQTRLSGRDQIRLDYPYAEVLDAGRRVRNGRRQGSTQAPDGMTKPFIQWVRRTMTRIFRG